MKTKRWLKPLIDTAMSVLLLLLMSYSLIGEELHEWLGVAMLILFVVHHFLNIWWYKSLAKGKYTALRMLTTLIDVFLFVDMFSLGFSGIMMSRTVFSFLKIDGNMEFARTLHMIASYWGFILMSFHIGAHWHSAINGMKKALHIQKTNKLYSALSMTAAFTVSAYGIYTMLHRQLFDYLFLRTHFVFFDFSEPIVFFLLDYASIVILLATIGYYTSKMIKSHERKAEMLTT